MRKRRKNPETPRRLFREGSTTFLLSPPDRNGARRFYVTPTDMDHMRALYHMWRDGELENQDSQTLSEELFYCQELLREWESEPETILKHCEDFRDKDIFDVIQQVLALGWVRGMGDPPENVFFHVGDADFTKVRDGEAEFIKAFVNPLPEEWVTEDTKLIFSNHEGEFTISAADILEAAEEEGEEAEKPRGGIQRGWIAPDGTILEATSDSEGHLAYALSHEDFYDSHNTDAENINEAWRQGYCSFTVSAGQSVLWLKIHKRFGGRAMEVLRGYFPDLGFAVVTFWRDEEVVEQRDAQRTDYGWRWVGEKLLFRTARKT